MRRRGVGTPFTGHPPLAGTAAHMYGVCRAPRPSASGVLSAHNFSAGLLSASGVLGSHDSSAQPPLFTSLLAHQSAWPRAATNFLGPQFLDLCIRWGYPWRPRLLGEDLSVFRATLSSPRELAAQNEILSKRVLLSLLIPTTSLFPPLPQGLFPFASCRS